MAYAEGTTVPIERSKTELKRVIFRNGAINYQFAEGEEKAMVQFAISGKLVRFVIQFPPPDDLDFVETPTGKVRSETQAYQLYEAECRRRWRSLILSIKGKFESARSEIESFEQAFLAHIVLPNNMTVTEFAIPQIEEAYKTKKMPKLLDIG